MLGGETLKGTANSPNNQS